jgi:hypothetical protein
MSSSDLPLREPVPGRRQIPITFLDGESITFTQDIKRKRRAARRARAGSDVDVASQDTIEEEPSVHSPVRAHGASSASGLPRADEVSSTRVSANNVAPQQDAIVRSLNGTGLDTCDAILRQKYNLRVIPIEADGHCLFSAAALHIYGDAAQYRRMRETVTAYMRGDYDTHPSRRQATREYFMDIVFGELLEPTEREHPKDRMEVLFDRYLDDMSKSAWGGIPELLAVEELFDRPVELCSLPAGVCSEEVKLNRVHFAGELPPSLNSPPLRFLYRDGMHYDALLPVDQVTVLAEYINAEEAYADDVWDALGESDADDSKLQCIQTVSRVPKVIRLQPSQIVQRRHVVALPEDWEACAAEALDEFESEAAVAPLRPEAGHRNALVRLCCWVPVASAPGAIREFRHARHKSVSS